MVRHDAIRVDVNAGNDGTVTENANCGVRGFTVGEQSAAVLQGDSDRTDRVNVGVCVAVEARVSALR